MKHLDNQILRDPLTSLLNEVTTGIYVEHHIKNLESGKRAILMLVNVDHYQKIKDEFGYIFAGEIITNMAEELQQIFKNVDVIGRKGNSTFIIFSTKIVTLQDVKEKADEITSTMCKTLKGVKQDFNITVSVGVSLYSRDGLDFPSLLNAAEMALNYAIVHETQKYEIYDIQKLSLYKKIQEVNNGVLSEYLWTQKQSSSLIDSQFDYQLMDFVFAIMDEKKDADKAISLILKKVAEYYHLTAIRILELIDGTCNVKCTYEWVENENFQVRNKIWMVDEYQLMQIVNKCNDTNEGIYEDSIDNPTYEKELFEQGDVFSFLRCSMNNGGKYTGSIDFVDGNNIRHWGAQEKHTLKTLARIVGLYLLKVKAYAEAARAVEDLTSFDELTGVLKYEKFLKRMKNILPSIDIYSKPIVINLDFSNFKYLNESYGYQAGDYVLRNMVDFIGQVLPEIIIITRVSADNIVCLVALPTVISIEDYMERITSAGQTFCENINLTYSTIHLELNCGLYEVRDRRIEPAIAVANANTARKVAKRKKKHECVLYTSKLDEENRNQMELAFGMRKALENKEFVVFYQPKIHSGDRTIIGAEALIRWQKPDGTLLFPDSFIPTFEKNGMIVELDFYVYDAVCRYLRERIDAGLSVVPISMNVSRIHMTQHKIVSYVKELMQQYQIPPELLEFEITESLYVENLEIALKLVNDFKDLGVKISIDDFGSGYSSLNVLRKLPINILKLDKGFLDGYLKNMQDQIIIINIMNMANQLHIKVLCEGVETEEQADFLEKNGCDYMQGYYFSKPIPESSFNELLNQQETSNVHKA